MFFLAKIKLYLIIAGLIATFVGGAIWYYRDTQAALQAYAANQAILETSLDTQKQATAALLQDIQRMRSVLGDLNKSFDESRVKTEELQQQFNQSKTGEPRDFGSLAFKKPGLIEKSVNTGTREVFRCIELLSKATPTPGEKNDQKYTNCIDSTVTDSLQQRTEKNPS